MRTTAAILMLLFLLSPSAPSQQPVTFSDLIRHAGDYTDAKVSDSERIEKAAKGAGLVNLTVRGRFSTG
jgi:hypothetical protein